MRVVDLTEAKTDLTPLQTELATTKQTIANLQQSLNQIGAPIAGMNQTLSNVTQKVLTLEARPIGTGDRIVSTVAELQTWDSPVNLMRVSSQDTGLQYVFRDSARRVLNIPGVIDHNQGQWVPTSFVPSPLWIQSVSDYDKGYKRFLIGEVATSVSFEIASQDKTQKGTFTLTDLTTGFSAGGGFWGLPNRFINTTAGTKTLNVMFGYNPPDGLLRICVQDAALPVNNRQGWFRNVKINGLATDYADVGSILSVAKFD